MKMTSVAIDEIYRERERFIIVGLTGRTGSGCTTAAEILKTNTFKELSLQQPKETAFSNCDERKYRIVYRYAEKHWSPFFIIKMSDIIASFVFQQGFEKMNEYMGKKVPN